MPFENLANSETANQRRNGSESFPAHYPTDGGSRLAKLKTEFGPDSILDDEVAGWSHDPRSVDASDIIGREDVIRVIVQGFLSEADAMTYINDVHDTGFFARAFLTKAETSHCVAVDLKVRARKLPLDRDRYAKMHAEACGELSRLIDLSDIPVAETPQAKKRYLDLGVRRFIDGMLNDLDQIGRFKAIGYDRHTSDPREFPFSQDEEAFDRLVFVPNRDNKPEWKQPGISWHGHDFAKVGSISVLVASAGGGKSHFVEMLAAAHLTDRPTMGFKTDPGMKLAIIDGERSKEEVYQAWERLRRRIGMDLPYPVYYGISAIADYGDKRGVVEKIVHDGSYKLLIIDGIGDLMENSNDLPETRRLIRGWLKPFVEQSDLTVLCTIHDNPDKLNNNTEKPQGHLGSELRKAANSVINMSYDKNTTLRKIYNTGFFGKMRHGPGNLESYFRWDDSLKMMMPCEADEAKALERTTRPTPIELEAAAREIFGKAPMYGLTRTPLKDALQTYFDGKYKLGDRTWDKVINDMAESYELLTPPETSGNSHSFYKLAPSTAQED